MSDERLRMLLYAFTGEENLRSLRGRTRMVAATLVGVGVLLVAWVRWSLQRDIGGTPLAVLVAVLAVGLNVCRLALLRAGRDPKIGMAASIALGTPLIGIPLLGVLGPTWVIRGTALGVVISQAGAIGVGLLVSRRAGTPPPNDC